MFQSILKLDVSVRRVTRSAICQARKKLKHTAFIDLLDSITAFLNQRNDLKTFKGYRTLAIDGSTLRLPDKQELKTHFGSVKNNSGRWALAKLSLLHDVLNRITYDAVIAPYSYHEQELAWDHLEQARMPERTLFLMDRGYSDFHFLRNIKELGHEFCVRVRGNFKVVKQLHESGLSDGLFTYKPSSTAKFRANHDPALLKPIQVRVVKLRHGSETCFLMTSLCDFKAITKDELSWLYHQRWQVEESYKVKKCRLRLEDFSGHTPEIIKQDFHAKVFAEALTAALTLDVEKELETHNLKTVHEYRICVTQALAKLKNTMVLLFFRKQWRKLLVTLEVILRKSLVDIVPGRKAKRGPCGAGSPKLVRPSLGYRYNR